MCVKAHMTKRRAESILKEKTEAAFTGSLKYEKARKGVRRMPRLSQAMKDVTSCDKLRVGANGH